MIEASVDYRELDKLVKLVEESPKVLSEAKRRAFEEAAPKLEGLVRREIGGTGKVQRWQAAVVGSKGGYAAVRPAKETYTEPNGRGKRYAVGYVTNAINSGHRFPSPSGNDKKYEPRIRSGRMNVPGKHFYEAAQAKAENIAMAAAEQVVQALVDHLEG